MPRYNYSAKSNSYLWQDAGLLAYSCVGDRSSQLPVGLLIGQSPLTGGSDTFTIKIVSRGAEGTISIGLVPFGYHTTSQPGWRAGSIGYHGDDGGLFLSSGQSTRRLEPFSAESSLPGCQVRCQLKPVSGRLRCIFSLDRRGVGDFVEVSSEPVEPPAGGFFACVGMHSPGEIVQLVDSAAWRPAAAETSAAVAGAVGSEDSGQEREPFDSVRYQLASVWPQLELPCHVQSVGLRGGNRGISGVLSGLLMIELRTSEPTQIRVISSGSVRCHLVTRAASGDSASAQSESESSWQSLLEMLGSIEEKRAPQFQGKGGGGKAAALTFKKKGGGGKGEQKEQEDEANSDADEDDKAERELVVNASRKDGQRFVCIRVLAPLHGAAAARAAASGQVSEMAEADKSLKGHDTVEVVVSGYGESQQRHKVQLRLLTPSELAAAGSQHQRRLFAVPFTEENARQAGGPCDLLEVLDSGVPLNRLLVPRRGWSLVFNRKAMAALHVRAENFPALNFSSSLQRGHWLRYTENSNSGDRALYRVTEVDDKEVSIKSLSVLNASATKVKLDSANLESPQLADLVSMSAASLANPEVLLPRFPSPNALGNWNRKSRHKFISNESFLYGHSCQFFRHRTVAGLGLSTVSSLLSGATRSNVGGGLLWVFLPQPGRLHRLGLAELGRPEQLRAHLMCCSGPTEVHLIDSAGIGHSMTSALECHQSAQPAIRQLLRNRLAIPSHKLLAPGGDADEAAASALSQELLQSRLWIEAAVRQHLLSGYSAAHWHSVSSVGHAAAAAAPAAGDATAAAADAASSSEPEVDSQQRQLVQQLMAAYVTPPPATQPDKLYAAGRLAPAACRAHLLCLTEGLLDEALEADPAGGVSAALRPYAECVRSARLMASTRLTDTASLTELTCLETLALIRLPGLRSLGPAGQLPTGRLRSLQVTKCDLESADAAAACPNLKSLSFSATKLATLPDSWKPDSPLETLTIDCCPMAALPASLGRLRHLRTLRLSQLPLRTLPPELASLQTLEELAVDGVAWPDSLMDNLTSGSHVTDGHKFLTAQRGVSMATGADQQEQQQRYFSALLTDAQVASISQSESLPATLARLVLEVPRLGADAPAEDEFGGLPPCLFELTNLKTLQLNYQAIRRIPDAIVRLRRLQSLQLSSNPLLESLSPRLAELPSLNHVDVGRCPALRTPPLEVVQRGSAALLSYLKFLASDQVECKRTKLMFVGLGGVGKTSLLRALRDPDNKTTAMGSEEITDGIDIGDWTIDIGDGSQPLNFSTWDFAGQKVYYNTHQFFLTHRAVYLLLYTVRTGYEHAGLDFWLSSISSHAPNAPILVVGTHSDQVEKGDNLPQDTFQARYPQIYNFHQVSSHTGAGISELRKELVKVALSQPYMNESVPRLFLDFEERLMEKRTRERLNILDWDVVSGIAQAQGLYEDKHVRQAVNFLNDIGSIQYFDTEFLRQKVVINPKWIVDVMACVVSVKNSHIQKGQLKKSDVPIVWANFDPALHDWLLKLTEAFDLTYPMQDDCNMVPCLLPEETPSYVFPPPTAEGSNCSLARFIYQFEYLPAGLFNRAQVRLFEFTDSATVWKRGSLLRKNNHEAVIVMDDKQRLSISVFGPKPENVLFMIRDVIDGLIKETFQGVHYEEILPCPECLNAPGATEAEISLIRVATVRKASSRQVAFLQCSQEFHILNLSQLLAAVPPVSTADFDHQLEQSLLQLRRVRLEMTRDLCLLFSSADYPDDPGSADEMARLINPEIVVQKMEAEGLTCYSTDQDMPEDRMLQIKDCKVLLVFLSKAFADDEACRGMFTNAKNILRKRMIFISVGADKSWRDSNEVAFLVGTDKYIDFTTNKKDVLASKFTELISDAKAAVATARQPESDLLGKDVFISYCWANSHDAASKGTRNSVLGCPDSDPRKVAARLQEKGIHCWLDVKDIGARSLFEDISDGLRQCSVVLAFASNEYQRSANCMMEFRFACRNLRKPVVMAIVGESLDFKTRNSAC
ncbi:hypothetical protein BOX15_Mlig030627g5 [Macrostomum lignano]|uniref:non-specific serine/threonine protein kinase n=1 Tax=Macrostomum lignano TaxID=282301 RepID=A0A267DHH3_9PLAT|nr:hypothetical protein BOX15_Mlig030627g5 [Macrostomum lignano]